MRHDIRVTMQSVVKSMRRESYVGLANEIANKLFGHKDFGVIIEDFFAAYVLDMNSFIFEQKEKISQLLQKVQGNPTDNNINRLELEVCSFTAALRSLALMREAKGISNNQELVSIYNKIYKLSYDFGEKDNVKAALSLLELLKKSFAFLPGAAKKIEDDINSLKKYLSSNQSTAVFKEANEALQKILAEEDSKLKYETGFSTEIMSFYNNEFCKCYQKMIEEILLRKGYQDEEYRCICYGAACLYKYMSSSLTWAERLDLAYPLAKRALQLAKSSKNKELIKAITDYVNELKPVANSSSSYQTTTSAPSRNSSSKASVNQPTAVFEVAYEALKKILAEEDNKLKFEAGFSAEIMSFYNNKYCNCYRKVIEKILLRTDYQDEEYRTICSMAAVIHMRMSSSLIWADRFDLAYLVAKRALKLARKSKDKELIKAITDYVNELKPVANSSSHKTASAPSHNNLSNYKITSASSRNSSANASAK